MSSITLAERPRIDARLRQRRIEVRRRQGRRRLRRLVMLGILAGLALAAWGLVNSPLLDVDTVKVLGTHQTSPSAVLEAAAVPVGSALSDVDLIGVETRVEALAWVAEADARRRWPGTVLVQVHERQPLAVVAAAPAGATWAVVDDEGRVLEEVAVAPPTLTLLAGVRASGGPGSVLGTDASTALAVARSLPAPLHTEVASVQADADGADLLLRNGAVVHLGSPDRLSEKYSAAAAVMAAGPLPAGGALDVRVPTAPVLVSATSTTRA